MLQERVNKIIERFEKYQGDMDRDEMEELPKKPLAITIKNLTSLLFIFILFFLMGIPYMGSKRKIAKPLVDFILQDHPKTKRVYDLFGGGGSMFCEFAKRGLEVHYNDLDIGVTKLFEKVLRDGVTDEMYRWISREEFAEKKDDKTWLGGLYGIYCIFDYLYKKIKNKVKAK